MKEQKPAIEFYNLYRGVKLPVRATKDLMGSMPVRAAQLCLPLRTASGFGFYLYPAFDFALRWDGQTSELTWLDEQGKTSEWLPLDGGVDLFHPDSVQLRSARQGVTEAELDEVFFDTGLPFANADPRAPQQMELNMGLVARTSPGWGCLIRGVPNFAFQRDVQVLEGFMETDWYRSPLVVILRLTTPGAVVRFQRSMPMAQLQVVPMQAFEVEKGGEEAESSGGIAEWPDDIWNEFVTSRRPRHLHERPGTYLIAARRAATERGCPGIDQTATDDD